MAIYSTKQLVRTKRVCRFAAVQCVLLFAAMSLVMLRVIYAQQAPVGTGQTFYSHGDPTSEEQYLLQKLNRARMDPVGEGKRLADWLRNTSDGQGVVARYGTNPDQVASDIAAFPAVAPLAFNPKLLAAARSHSNDLASHDGLGPGGDANPLLDHNGYDGSTPDVRVAAAGYTGYPGTVGGAFAAENYFPGAIDLDSIHAGFLIDWGNPGFGHRKIAYGGTGLYEVGIGLAIKPDSLNSGNPLVCTEDFGSAGYAYSRATNRLGWADAPALLIGVVYRDANGNGLYDVGEGVSGVQVAMDGGAYYTVTSGSGGYALPLVKADGSNALGNVAVHMTGMPGGTSYSSVLNVKTLATSLGPIDVNVGWDGLVDQNTSTAPDEGTATITGGGTVKAGSTLKLVVSRPSGSSVGDPLTLIYKTKGTAVAGIDFKSLPGTVTIPAGISNTKIRVKTMASSGNPTSLTLKLKGVPGARGKATATFMP